MTTEQLITVSIVTVQQIAQRVAREVAHQHANLPEGTQAQISDETTKAVLQVYCAELIAARLRQVELACYDSITGVASQIKAIRESRS